MYLVSFYVSASPFPQGIPKSPDRGALLPVSARSNYMALILAPDKVLRTQHSVL